MKKAASIAISVARPDDLPELLRLVRAYYRYDGIRYRRSIVPAALARLLRGGVPARIWIGRDGGRAIGYVAFSYHYDAEFGGLEGVITDLFVNRRYRGHGLGSRLLATVEDYCRSAGIGSIELQVIERNRAAAGFYRKHGFRRLARIIMARDIGLRRSGGKARKR
jgi:ribosomal protein S18 acetylase RimI-like enzyme